MIILPIGEDSIPAPLQPASTRPAQLQSTARLLVFGFTPAERELIQGVVALSQRRSLCLKLVGGDAPETADFILFDGADPKVMKWVSRGGLPRGKPVIQVDGPQAALPGLLYLQRPIQWPQLPTLLLQALGLEAPVSSRLPLSTF